ncbi:MAG TPA: hypothetical protein VFQ39_15215, partial [Longimicrobium sp.]|nr:hypothetical protein [Longimicrobium sp.]
VISLFSSTYTGGTGNGDYSAKVDSYNATCFGPPGNTVADYTIAGTAHVVKQYSMAANSFGIVETIGATGGTAVPPDSAICNGGTQTGANVIDITAMTGVHFDVWSPGGSGNFQVQVVGADSTGTIAGPGQAPGATPGTTYASGANTIAAGAWVAVDLPFSSFGPGGAPGGISRLALVKFFSTDGGTFFIDNLYFYKGSSGGGGGGGTPGTFPSITFDEAAVTYTLTDFGGAASSVVTDPVTSNAGNHVVQVVKGAGAQVWAGTTVSTGANASVPAIPFSASRTKMSVRVYSPAAGIHVRFKVENQSNGGISVETEALTTLVNTWETLTFDFANPASGTPALDLTKTYDKGSLFFDFGNSPGAAETFWFDDITFLAWDPITFDDAAVTYTLTDFGGAASSMVIDPDGAHPSNHVVQVVKGAGAQVWAGTTVSTGANFSVAPIPFSTRRTKMTARVYSPAAGIHVRLKVENQSNGGISVETEALTTQVNTWETLTFDFSSPAAGTAALDLSKTYDKASLFFDFGTSPAAAETFWFDDLAFVL